METKQKDTKVSWQSPSSPPDASSTTIPTPDAAQLVHQILLQIRAAILEYQNLEALGDRYDDKIEVVTKPKSDLLFLLAPLIRTKLSFGVSSGSTSRRSSFLCDNGDVPGDYVDSYPVWLEDLTWGVSSESAESDIMTAIVQLARGFRFSLVQHGFVRLDTESLYARCLVQNLATKEQLEVRFVWVPEEKKWLLHDFLLSPKGGERTMGYDSVTEAEQRFEPSQSLPSPPQSTHTASVQTEQAENDKFGSSGSSDEDDDYWDMYGQQGDDDEDDDTVEDPLAALVAQSTNKGSKSLEEESKTSQSQEDDYYSAYDSVETAVGGDEPEVEDTPTEVHVMESIKSLKRLCEGSGISQSRFAELVKRGLTEE